MVQGEAWYMIRELLRQRLSISEMARILRAADAGAATGNRPIPYLFELCNIEASPPVAPPEPVSLPTAERPAPPPPRARPWWAFWRRG